MLDEAVEPLRLRGRPFISPKKVLNDPNDLRICFEMNKPHISIC